MAPSYVSYSVLRLQEKHILLFVIMYVVSIVKYMYCTLSVHKHGYMGRLCTLEVVRSRGVYACFTSARRTRARGEPPSDLTRRPSCALSPAPSTVLNLAVVLRADPPHRLDKHLTLVDIDVLQLDLQHITTPELSRS